MDFLFRGLSSSLLQLHMLGDGGVRGATLETCLTKILCLSSETTIHTTVVRSTGTTVVWSTGTTVVPL